MLFSEMSVIGLEGAPRIWSRKHSAMARCIQSETRRIVTPLKRLELFAVVVAVDAVDERDVAEVAVSQSSDAAASGDKKTPSARTLTATQGRKCQ